MLSNIFLTVYNPKQFKFRFKWTQLVKMYSTFSFRPPWASIARSQDIPIAVISEAMGHDSEQTTQIYLNSILIDRIDSGDILFMGLNNIKINFQECSLEE